MEKGESSGHALCNLAHLRPGKDMPFHVIVQRPVFMKFRQQPQLNVKVFSPLFTCNEPVTKPGLSVRNAGRHKQSHPYNTKQKLWSTTVRTKQKFCQPVLRHKRSNCSADRHQKKKKRKMSVLPRFRTPNLKMGQGHQNL